MPPTVGTPALGHSKADAFVGRDAELSRLGDLLDARARLVVVTGPGGVGKSRLALESADSQAGRFGAGILICECDEARSVGDVCVALSTALGVDLGAEGGREQLEWLGGVLAARGPTLLLLDNFEQLAPHARLLDGLLDSAPELTLLVTSTTRLRLGRESVLELRPLALPTEEGGSSPAVDLFIERARHVQTGYTPTAADARVIGQIVRDLDGMPLAIELVAARTRVLAPRQILERLTESVSKNCEAEGQARPQVASSSKHASLRDTVEWSWRLLDTPEQTTLAQLTVFRGGFDVELAEAVVDLSTLAAGANVLDAVTGLRDKSLLHASAKTDTEIRLAMYGAIREFAAEELERAGIRAATLERHARAVLARGALLAELLHGHSGQEAFPRLLGERENLLAVFESAVESVPQTPASAKTALEAAAVLNDVSIRRGPLPEQLERLDRAIDLGRALCPTSEMLAWSLLARGQSLRAAAEIARALADHAEAAERARVAEQPMFEAECWLNAVFTLHVASRVDDAVALYDERLGPVVGSLPARLRGLVLGCRGGLHLDLADYSAAERMLREAIDLLSGAGDVRHVGLGHHRLGDALRASGRFDDARRHYDQSLVLVRSVHDRPLECACLTGYAALHHELAEISEARRLYEEASVGARHLGARSLDAAALIGLASLDADAGALDAAEDRLVRAARIAGELGDSTLASRVALAEGHVALARAASAARAGDGVTLAQELVRAQGALESGLASPVGRTSEILRSATRLLAASLAQAAELGALAVGRASAPPAVVPPPSHPVAATEERQTLIVGRDGWWFRPPFGDRVSLRRHTALRLVLSELVVRRLSAPGEPVPRARLLEAGWPGERVLYEAGALRVYGAIAALRRFGLRGVLVTMGEGYALDPDVPVREQRVNPGTAG